LEKSGSPQVRATGQSILQPIDPALGFESLVSGKQSPRAAFKSTVKSEEAVPLPAQIVLSGLMPGMPTGKVLEWLGLGGKPTTGTMFRNEIGQVFNQVPELKGTDTSKYNIDPNAYNAIDPGVRARAQALAGQLETYAPDSKKNPEAYQNQIVAMLLN